MPTIMADLGMGPCVDCGKPTRSHDAGSRPIEIPVKLPDGSLAFLRRRIQLVWCHACHEARAVSRPAGPPSDNTPPVDVLPPAAQGAADDKSRTTTVLNLASATPWTGPGYTSSRGRGRRT